MPRPLDWNSESSRFAVILRDMDTCVRFNAVVALSIRGGGTIEVWVRDCTAAETAGDFNAVIPNTTFTTGPWDPPIPPVGPIRDGMPGSGTLAERAQLVVNGEVGTGVFEAWKLARCFDAIADHAAQRP